MLQLKDAVALIAKCSPEEFASNGEVRAFIEDIGLASSEIIKNIPDEDILAASDIIKGGIVGELVAYGNIKMVIALMSDMEAFDTVVAASMKLILGLRDIEGWK